MKALIMSLMVMILVYTNTFKSDFKEEDLALASIACIGIIALILLGTMIGG